MSRPLPAINFPPELPVSERRDDIAAAIAAHPVVIVAGETGSGKTTQLPKICLQLGRGQEARIGHTQPRRLAARTVAQRIAEELGQETGALVGYQVRFQEAVGENTAVKLMTDGILLAELQHDRDLRRYDTLIIDEAHERSLNIDFILGYLKKLLPRRPDLKVVITSATIDVQRFSAYFDDAPVIEVSGRSYPVETHYLPRDPETDLANTIAREVEAIQAGQYGQAGDTLVFLSGERDIRLLARTLRGRSGLDVLPLYARLSRGEQDRVFGRARARGMRVVLSTNVAETSVTVPGIRYVIDPGEARLSRYSYRTRVQRLPIEAVSQASADQRRGRCGRVGPGVCLRLYSEEDYLNRPEFTDPEIQRSNLAAVVLRMLHLGLGRVEQFPFIDPPDARLVRDGYRLLEELGAVNARHRLTRLGRRMAAIPIDPTLSRMLLAAEARGVVPELLIIASALSIQDPRERPADHQSQADQAHARFRDPRSDFVALLNLWRYYEEQRQALSENQLRKLCRREFLSYLRMREWRDLHRQLLIAVRGQGLKVPPSGEELDYASVHRALLAGLLGNVAQQDERREYLGARNRRLQLFPGSALYRKPPKWLVAAEIVETGKVYARMAAAIEPVWVLDINPAVLKQQYYEPRWNPDRASAEAWRRTVLFGLTVQDRVRVAYGKIDPVASRELLIREGLVAGRWKKPPAFLKANLRRKREVEDLESRIRRRDLLVDDEQLFKRYNERLPQTLVNGAGLEHWLKEDPARTAVLTFEREHFLLRDPEDLQDQFPDRLHWDGQDYRLSYQFSPGNEADGVSVTVPVALLNRLPRARLEWLVPGLLREKGVALVKALPKTLRKQLVPVPDWVDRALERVSPADRPFGESLGEALRQLGGPRIDSSVWSSLDIDAYYRMNLRVVDARGRLLAQGRNIDALVDEFREQTRDQLNPAANTPARQGLTVWPDEAIPREHRFRQAGVQIQSFPALADRDDHVDVELFDYPAQAFIAHRRGVARLLMLNEKALFRELRRRLLKSNELALIFAALGLSRDQLVHDLLPAVALAAAGAEDCRDRDSFDAARRLVAAKGVSMANEAERHLSAALQAMAGSVRFVARHGEDFAAAAQDMAATRSELVGEGALIRNPWDWFSHYPRYAKAMAVRAERLAANYARDQQLQQQVCEFEARYRDLVKSGEISPEISFSLQRYRLMLQEFRVSLFAQQLGTSQAVSAKRLEAQWERVQRWIDESGGRTPEKV